MQQQNPNDRPPYVKFITRPVEDRSTEIIKGKYGFRDIHLAQITRPGQKDTVERVAQEWIDDLHRQAADSRIPQTWPEGFQKMYDAWKNGQEVPVEGTPIRGWPLLSPAQQETILLAGIRTVEDLATMSDEAVRHIGTGGVTFRNTAKGWLDQANDKGAVAAEVATLKRDNESLTEQNKEMREQLAALSARLDALAPKEAPKGTL
jgi:hypothetical protein